MRTIALTSLIAVLLLPWALAACATVQAAEKYGPFRGHFVDAETGEPLKDVAVLVVWWEAIFSPTGHPTRKFYEAKEAVADAEGRFEVPRLSVPFWKLGIQPGQVIFFGPGYVEQGKVVTPPDGQPFVDPTVVQMRRLKTREERIGNQRRYPPSIPARKMPVLLEALNRERVALGLEPITRGDVSDP